jgi:preprotein translocase subunit SecE
VADNKRGGRSDDEFDDSELDEYSDSLDDADDRFGSDDDGEDADDGDLDRAEPVRGTRARSATAAKRVPARAATRAQRARAKDSPGPSLLDLPNRLVRFVREVVAELQKVIWPTRKELLTYTSVVVVFVTIVMTVVALLDLGFAKTMFEVFGGKTIAQQ